MVWTLSLTKASTLKVRSDNSNYWISDDVSTEIFLGKGHKIFVVFAIHFNFFSSYRIYSDYMTSYFPVLATTNNSTSNPTWIFIEENIICNNG